MISIVIPYYKQKDEDQSQLERLLDSIKDQDYKDYEIIVEHDTEGLGAGVTRNKGAEKAKGEILFFIDHDCMLQPGMLREVNDQFEDNPNITFVYGNHRYFGKTVQEFYSQPFDPYLLETFNYIPTMSPMRKAAFDDIGGFRDKPYFQDWDLFYRLSKAGYVGKWINEFMFWTEQPTENSISGIKIPLDEKCSNFRKWNNIPDKNLVVTTFGAPLQAIQRAKLLNADYVGPGIGTRRAIFPKMLNFKNWESTYLVGCYNETIEQLENHLNCCIGKPIIHFIGTDVYQLTNYHPVTGLKEIRDKLKEIDAAVYANSPRMVQELNDCMISAELLYTPLYNPMRFQYEPLPEKFTVAVMISDTNPMHMPQSDRSHVELIYDVARAMPTIDFKFFGSDQRGKDRNMEWVGKIKDIENFIPKTSMLLRATLHDGFPQSPIQWQLSGRDVLLTVPDDMPQAFKLSFEDVAEIGYTAARKEIIEQIYTIRDMQKLENGEIRQDLKMDPKIKVKYLKEEYDQLMEPHLFKQRVFSNISGKVID